MHSRKLNQWKDDTNTQTSSESKDIKNMTATPTTQSTLFFISFSEKKKEKEVLLPRRTKGKRKNLFCPKMRKKK